MWTHWLISVKTISQQNCKKSLNNNNFLISFVNGLVVNKTNTQPLRRWVEPATKIFDKKKCFIEGH